MCCPVCTPYFFLCADRHPRASLVILAFRRRAPGIDGLVVSSSDAVELLDESPLSRRRRLVGTPFVRLLAAC